MAFFDFSFTPVNVDIGGNVWVDPPSSLPNALLGTSMSIPTRQNARDGIPHRYTRFYVNVQIEVKILTSYTGSWAFLPDALLGGVLYQAWFAEVPGTPAAWSSFPGQSSYQFFTPLVKGAYLAVFSRPGMGGILWHFMVE